MLHLLHLITFLLRPVPKRHPLTHILETPMLIPTVCLSRVARGSTHHSTVSVSVHVRVGSFTFVSICVYLGVPLQIGC
jgi:hypothetical protein